MVAQGREGRCRVRIAPADARQDQIVENDIPVDCRALPLAERAAARAPQPARRNVGGRDVVAGGWLVSSVRTAARVSATIIPSWVMRIWAAVGWAIAGRGNDQTLSWPGATGSGCRLMRDQGARPGPEAMGEAAERRGSRFPARQHKRRARQKADGSQQRDRPPHGGKGRSPGQHPAVFAGMGSGRAGRPGRSDRSPARPMTRR